MFADTTTVSHDLPKPWGPTLRKWTDKDIQYWESQQVVQRSYNDGVLSRLKNLPDSVENEVYGKDGDYELRLLKIGNCDGTKPIIMITGGVHGYEKGGIDAAITFAEKFESDFSEFSNKFDFVIFPCINPYAYERDIRWNRDAQDPNRHCIRDASKTESGKPAPQCVAFMDAVDKIQHVPLAHIDLHETTDRDLKLRELKLLRDGNPNEPNRIISQGFYLAMNVGDENSELGKAVIVSVAEVTKIAEEPEILGVTNRNGIVCLDGEKYPGLCMNYTQTRNRITTEIYPDIINEAEALNGQLAAIRGTLRFLANDSSI